MEDFSLNTSPTPVHFNQDHGPRPSVSGAGGDGEPQGRYRAVDKIILLNLTDGEAPNSVQ